MTIEAAQRVLFCSSMCLLTGAIVFHCGTLWTLSCAFRAAKFHIAVANSPETREALEAMYTELWTICGNQIWGTRDIVRRWHAKHRQPHPQIVAPPKEKS